MAFSAVALAVSAAGAAYSASESRKGAKEQAAATREAAADAALQAAESARGNALARQTAIERQNVDEQARRRERDAALTLVKPEVQIEPEADPIEQTRRRQVRASFTVDDDEGSIRL